MQILAVETSGRLGSLALLRGGPGHAQLLGQFTLEGNQRAAQALAPALRQLLASANCPSQSIGLVAVAVGPGSFTGLRIGVTTAKVFAYAVGAEIIGVNTLQVLACQASTSTAPLWTIMEAQRQELFATKFDGAERDPIQATTNTRIIAQDQWLAELKPGDRVTGPALRRLLPRLPAEAVVEPEELWQPTAEFVGQVAWQLHQRGQRDDVWKLAPNYYRPSAAEEKAAQPKSTTNI